MNTYDIWVEGYAISGNRSTAMFIGSTQAMTFQEACDILCSNKESYSSENKSIWGCRLFDNEKDARKSFG